METDLAKPFSYWKPLDHEMLKFSLNTLFYVYSLFFRFTDLLPFIDLILDLL